MFEFRSVMFVPGANEKALAKSSTLNADLTLFDLEDSVHLSKKKEARALVKQTITALRDDEATAHKSIGVRVNDLTSDNTLADLEAVLPAKPDLIVLPKVCLLYTSPSPRDS